MLLSSYNMLRQLWIFWTNKDIYDWLSHVVQCILEFVFQRGISKTHWLRHYQQYNSSVDNMFNIFCVKKLMQNLHAVIENDMITLMITNQSIPVQHHICRYCFFSFYKCTDISKYYQVWTTMRHLSGEPIIKI